MSATGPKSGWRAPVADYLMAALPVETGDGRDGWNDLASTAWQFGCMGLAALGYAKQEPWGAARLAVPVAPKALPRWDDMCRVVLTVLRQRREISYRLPDGAPYVPPRKEGQFSVKVLGEAAPLPAAPNIAAAHGCGPAYVAPDLLGVLSALGLVRDGAWSAEAELVLWCVQPEAWDMAVVQDARFGTGLALCLETMPEDVVETLHDLVEITAEELDAAMEQQRQAVADLIARYPVQANYQRPIERAAIFRTAMFRAEHQMDDLFFAKWRLTDGWLSGVERTRALPLFHDPLVQLMRAAAFNAMGLAFPKEIP